MSPKRQITEKDILSLRSLLSSFPEAKLLTPSSPAYPATISRWSPAASKPSGASLIPSSAAEISLAVRYATENNIDLAIKGGGHSTAGASSTDGGLLIDLSGAMRRVRVDPEKKLIYAQGGCNWGEVDAEAWRYGLATVGGTVADTGVGGLTLGGGYGILSGLKGLVVDNLVEAEVVLADGRIVRASEGENEELFWGLRGAGQNFGVTTEFVLKAHEQGEVFGGQLVFAPEGDTLERVVGAINGLYEEGRGSDGRFLTMMGFAKPPPAGGRTMVIVLCVFLGAEKEGREIFKPLRDVGPVMDMMKTMTYPEANKMVPVGYGKRASMKGAAYMMPLRPGFAVEVLKEFESFTNACPDATESLIMFETFDPTVVATLDNGSFANRGYHLNGLVMPSWTDEKNDQQCRQWARDVSNMFKKELEAKGEEPAPGVEGGASVRGHKGAVMLYGNYDQYDEISKDIFGSNYPRLQSLKSKYDPTNMFDKLFPIRV